MLGQIMEQAGISILVGCVCLYFAYRVMILKDIKAIRGKGKPEPEDKEGYCKAPCVFWHRFLYNGRTGDGESDGGHDPDGPVAGDHVRALEKGP